MVGHLLEYHPGVQLLKDVIDSGELGEIRYLYDPSKYFGKIISKICKCVNIPSIIKVTSL